MPDRPPRVTSRRPAWGTTQGYTRMRGRKLQRARMALYAKDPRCAQCHRVLLPSEAIRDHIENLAAGGEDIESNTQLLCIPCSDAKTQQEAEHGKARRI